MPSGESASERLVISMEQDSNLESQLMKAKVALSKGMTETNGDSFDGLEGREASKENRPLPDPLSKSRMTEDPDYNKENIASSVKPSSFLNPSYPGLPNEAENLQIAQTSSLPLDETKDSNDHISTETELRINNDNSKETPLDVNDDERLSSTQCEIVFQESPSKEESFSDSTIDLIFSGISDVLITSNFDDVLIGAPLNLETALEYMKIINQNSSEAFIVKEQKNLKCLVQFYRCLKMLKDLLNGKEPEVQEFDNILNSLNT